MRGKFISVVAALACAAMPVSAGAVDSRELEDQIAQNLPGIQFEEVRAAVEDYSATQGITYEEGLQQLAQELEDHPYYPEDDGSYRGGGEGVKIKLDNAWNKGDIFYSPVSIAYGHVGIYGDKDWIVEAPGVGQLSHWKWAEDVDVVIGSIQMEVNTSQSKRNAAADYAYKNLVGRNYNKNFVDNRKWTWALNCSQLVWLAYHTMTGLDLDADKGMGVYPIDIKNSPLTKQNWVVQ